MRIKKLQHDLDSLTIRVERLEERIQQTQDELCPLCHGEMRRSPLYPWLFCQQDYGHCGFLVLHPVTKRRGGDWPKAHFTRTQVNTDTGKLHDLSNYMYMPKGVWFFVAGKQVTQEEYFKL